VKRLAYVALALAASALVAQSAPQPPAGAFQPPSRGGAAPGPPARLQAPAPRAGGPPAEAPPPPPPQPYEAWRFNARERTARGVAAWNHEKPAEAVEALDTAARLKPGDALAAYNSGTAHLGAGLGDAEPILERALANVPEGLAADVHFNLGNARLAAQNAAGAIDSFKETLRRAPGHAGARRNLELAQRLLEQQKKQQQEQQQDQNQDQNQSGDGQQNRPQPQPESGDPNEPQPPQDGESGDSQPPEKPQDGDGQQQGGGSQRQNPLPQFKDQEDMTAEQAAAILQAVDNLEREKRRDEAKQRARAKSTVEKDW
jgi:hypothetical protein